jgi:hypothetical protein
MPIFNDLKNNAVSGILKKYKLKVSDKETPAGILISRKAVRVTLPTETLSPTSPRLIRAIIPIPISSAVPWFSLVVWASILPIIGPVIIRIRIDDITPLKSAQYT